VIDCWGIAGCVLKLPNTMSSPCVLMCLIYKEKFIIYVCVCVCVCVCV
jgi:hypothetical protein